MTKSMLTVNVSPKLIVTQTCTYHSKLYYKNTFILKFGEIRKNCTSKLVAILKILC